MKKIIGSLLLICTLTLCLASCASLKSYEKNLGKAYEITTCDKDEFKDLENAGIYVDDYGVSAIIKAQNRVSEHEAYIIQCKSSKKANELVDDLDLYVQLTNIILSSKVDAVADGKFVLFGNKDVIDDALDK